MRPFGGYSLDLRGRPRLKNYPMSMKSGAAIVTQAFRGERDGALKKLVRIHALVVTA